MYSKNIHRTFCGQYVYQVMPVFLLTWRIATYCGSYVHVHTYLKYTIHSYMFMYSDYEMTCDELLYAICSA